jgi:hypothetical protein
MRPLGGRHAAVIPALPDEYENLLPIGTLQYHDKQRNVPPPDPSRGLSYYPQHIIQQAQQERQQQEQRQPSQQVSPFTLQSLRYSRGLLSNSRITLSLPTIQKEISSNMISSFGSPYRSTTFNCIPKAFTTGNSFISRYFRYQHFLPTSEISSLVRLLVSSASDHLLRRMCHQSHLGRLPVLVVGLPSCSSQSHKPPVHIAIMYYKRRSFHSIPFERT